MILLNKTSLADKFVLGVTRALEPPRHLWLYLYNLEGPELTRGLWRYTRRRHHITIGIGRAKLFPCTIEPWGWARSRRDAFVAVLAHELMHARQYGGRRDISEGEADLEAGLQLQGWKGD